MHPATRSRPVVATLALATAVIAACASVAFAIPGDLDSSFGGDGKVTTNLGPVENIDGFARAVAYNPITGTTVIAGQVENGGSDSEIGLMRVDEAGNFDQGFGNNGRVVTDRNAADPDEGALAVALDSSGRTLVCAQSGGANVVIRYFADGSLDTGFGTGGSVAAPFGGSTRPCSIAVDSFDRPVIAGDNGHFVFARFDLDGAPDLSFGTGGTGVQTVDAGSLDSAYGVAIDPSDGAIVGAGVRSPNDYAIVRLDSNGVPDTNFGPLNDGVFSPSTPAADSASSVAVGTGGAIFAAGGSGTDFDLLKVSNTGTQVFHTAYNFGGTEFASSIHIELSGQVVMAGRSEGDFAVTRVNPTTGTQDAGFGSPRIIDMGGTDVGNGVAVADGNTDDVLVVGTTTLADGHQRFAIAGRAPNGDPQTFFSGDGKLLARFEQPSGSQANAITRQADGKLVVAGITDAGNGDVNGFVNRYLANGSLDPGFSGDGVAIVDLDPSVGSDDSLRDVAVQTDGKIVVVGGITQGPDIDIGLARLNSNGTPDAGFGIGGVDAVDLGSQESAFAVRLQGAKLLVAGSTGGANQDAMLARYDPATGTLDPGFGTGGSVIDDWGPAGDDDLATDLALQADGKVVVSGTSEIASNHDMLAARYSANGVIDSGFGSGGERAVSFTATGGDGGLAIGLQKDGRVVLGGSTSTGDFAIARLTAQGALDSAFSGDGKQTTSIRGGLNQFDDLALQPDGKIVGVGAAELSGDVDVGVVRYRSDGSLDKTFSGDGKASTDFGSFSYGAGVVIQADGKIAIAGFSGTQIALARFQGLAPAPQTTIKGKTRSRSRRPKFTLTSTETGSTFQCKLDKGAFKSCSSPFKTPKLKRGKHTLSVRATGRYDNTDASPAVKKFKVIRRKRR